MRSTPAEPRRTALSVLDDLDAGARTLDLLLDDRREDLAAMDKRDRSLAQAVIFGVLRWRGRLDWIIRHFSKTGSIDPGVMNILRIGLFQALCLDRIPAHAAVHTSVELAKRAGARNAAGFVNALLRNAATNHQKATFPDRKKNLALALSVEKSFPEWMVRRWLDRFGPEDAELLCDAVNVIPPITLRANALKTDPARLAQDLQPYAQTIRSGRYAPEALHLFGPAVAIPDLPAFRAGGFQVQDEAAQLATLLLDPRPGEHVLDACAGLGGKTGHMAGLIKNAGRITAADADARKLLALAADMQRLGADIVQYVHADLTSSRLPLKAGGFDRVMLDAPCSGMGVLRRNPDIKWSAALPELARHRETQSALLDRAATLVKPGGVLGYAVCSAEPEETDDVVRGFLAGRDDFDFRPPIAALDWRGAGLVDKNGCLRTFPHRHGIDGFFSVCFKRKKRRQP